MKILGIDPGTAIVGFGVLDKLSGDKYGVITYGKITTSKDKDKNDRLFEVFSNVNEIIEKYEPKVMAIEKLYYNKNPKTVMSVSEARGAIIIAAKMHGLKVFEYTPLQVKQAITGYGRAEKKEIQNMVKKLLNLESVPKPDDVADALAIALCHGNFFNYEG